MYFAFMWMDQWLKIMEAFTAEQARFVQSGAERASLDEITNLRGALADREQALAAAEAALYGQEAVHAEIIKKAAEAERRLQIEEREKAGVRRELERTRAEPDKVRVERASALQSQDRLARTLADLRLETERERKGRRGAPGRAESQAVRRGTPLECRSTAYRGSGAEETTRQQKSNQQRAECDRANGDARDRASRLGDDRSVGSGYLFSETG